MIGKSSTDAIGISANVAGRLSGADFDGDTVMCIPTHDRGGKVKITSTPELKDLEGFDPKLNYGGECRKDSAGKEHYYRNGREYRLMTKTDTEMGKISNLITDMTLIGATEDELARAVKHSIISRVSLIITLLHLRRSIRGKLKAEPLQLSHNQKVSMM